MTATRRSPSDGSTTIKLPLILIILLKTAKSKEIFRLQSFCHIAIRVEAYRAQNALTQCQNCQQFGHVWANCKQQPRCLWCGGGHCTRSAPRKEIQLPTQHPATVGWRKEKIPIPPIIGAVDTRRRICKTRSRRGHPGLQREGCSLPTSPLQACPLQRHSEARQEQQQQQPQTHQVAVAGPSRMEHKSLWPYSNTNSRQQVSQFGRLM
jgi:hypothetical protein